MINMSKFLVLDFETNALDNKKNQPVSIGALMIDPRKLTLCEQGVFYSLISIIPDEDGPLYNLCPTEQKALDVNKLTLEEIMAAPPLKKVWGEFVNWVKFHTAKNDKWAAPILCGHNNPYDKTILERIQFGHLSGDVVLPEKLLPKTKAAKIKKEELGDLYRALTPYKEPWKYGPDWLFHPSINLDTLPLSFTLFENCREPHRLSLDSLKNFLGMPDEGAHNALGDVLSSAEILVRYLRLMRQVYRDTDFSNLGDMIMPSFKSLTVQKKEVEECPF